MGERALFARERDDGRFEVAVSQWGGSDRALAAVFAGRTPDVIPGISWETRGPTRFAVLVERVDYLVTAALYRVRGVDTTVFLPVWFGLPLRDASTDPGVGALVAVDSLSELRQLRTYVRDLKGTLTDAVRAGYVPASVAPAVFRRVVAALEGRERYVATGHRTGRLYSKGRPEGP